MTVLSVPELRQTAAIVRAEGLRRHCDAEVTNLLDTLVDMSYASNVVLNTCERVCKFCNDLEALPVRPATGEIKEVVRDLRKAFGLAHDLVNGAGTYGPVVKILDGLNAKHPAREISKTLRQDTTLYKSSPVVVKKRLGELTAQLFVIAMNADDAAFLADVKKAISEIMDVSFTWI